MGRGVEVNEETKAFGRYENGFTITFENGLVLSTRFGEMNYCENKSDALGTFAQRTLADKMADGPLLSDNAEVAVWRNRGTTKTNDARQWVTEWQQDIFQDSMDSDVRGWVQIKNWLQLLDWCRNWQSE